MPGSSPLARGTYDTQDCTSILGRLIPARAGNITGTVRGAALGQAHPRSRGEHLPAVPDGIPLRGSSPLARGTWKRFISSRLRTRLIPARAGNMCQFSGVFRRAAAHPRSRGEHLLEEKTGHEQIGSSPLARGTCSAVLEWRAWNRLIPARAGNIVRGTGSIWGLAAHPRSRGEHSRPWDAVQAPAGSSPLARGTSQRRPRRSRQSRLIPARAGNMFVVCGLCGCLPAHPRSRGEHDCTAYRVGFVTGSSPLARGTSTRAENVRRVTRLIPARAGNIAVGDDAPVPVTAHPRSRGEHAC